MRFLFFKILCTLWVADAAALQQTQSRNFTLVAEDGTSLSIGGHYLTHVGFLAPMLKNINEDTIPLTVFSSAVRKKSDYDQLCLQDLVEIVQAIHDNQETPQRSIKALLFKDNNHPSTSRCIALFALANYFEISPLLSVLVEYVAMLVLEKKHPLYKTILAELPVDLLTEVFYRYVTASPK